MMGILGCRDAGISALGCGSEGTNRRVHQDVAGGLFFLAFRVAHEMPPVLQCENYGPCPRNIVTLWSTIKFLEEIALVSQSGVQIPDRPPPKT
jgi:hypothetical protein